MREAVRERIDSLRSMLVQPDPFERDEEKMRLFAYSSKYSRARKSLIRQFETNPERKIFERLDATARSVEPANTLALSALFDDSQTRTEVDAAVQASIDGHLLLLRRLDELVITIHQTAQSRIQDAGEEFHEALLSEALLGAIAIAIAMVAAAYVVINAGARNNKLSHQAAHDLHDRAAQSPGVRGLAATDAGAVRAWLPPSTR